MFSQFPVPTRKTVLRHQLILRFLLHLKHVEQWLPSMKVSTKTTLWQAHAHASATAPSSGDWQMDKFQAWRKRVCRPGAEMFAYMRRRVTGM